MFALNIEVVNVGEDTIEKMRTRATDSNGIANVMLDEIERQAPANFSASHPNSVASLEANGITIGSMEGSYADVMFDALDLESLADAVLDWVEGDDR